MLITFLCYNKIMTNELEKTALLLMDLQPGIIDNLDNKDEFLKKVQTTIDFAHKNKIQIIYVVVSFREGAPEISSSNKIFSTMKERASSSMVNINPVFDIQYNDILVTKHRISAFSGSDLDMILRAGGFENIVISGISTSGVVLSTTREAADKDFKITILSDLCFDSDPEVHLILMNKIFPRQANIITSNDWFNNINSN